MMHSQLLEYVQGRDYRVPCVYDPSQKITRPSCLHAKCGTEALSGLSRGLLGARILLDHCLIASRESTGLVLDGRHRMRGIKPALLS